MTTVSASISAVIPTYNCGPYIEEALRSVLLQTRLVDEVVVIDDGSTDDTAIRVAHFDRVRYIRQDNGGVVAAIRRGFAEARGRWIALLDADDVWMPDKIARQTSLAAAHPEAALIASGVAFCDERGALLPERGGVSAVARWEDLRGGISSYPSTWLLKAEAAPLIADLPWGEPYAWDWEFQIKLMRAGGGMRAIPEALVRRRVHAGQLGAQHERLLALKVGVVRRHHRAIAAASGGRIRGRDMLFDIHLEAAKNLFHDPSAEAFAERHLRHVLRRAPMLIARPLFWAHLLIWAGAYGRRSPADAAGALAARLGKLHDVVADVYDEAPRQFRRRLPPPAAASAAIDLGGAVILAQSGRPSAGAAMLGKIAMTRPLGTSRVLGRMLGRSIAQRLKHAAG